MISISLVYCTASNVKGAIREVTSELLRRLKLTVDIHKIPYTPPKREGDPPPRLSPWCAHVHDQLEKQKICGQFTETFGKELVTQNLKYKSPSSSKKSVLNINALFQVKHSRNFARSNKCSLTVNLPNGKFIKCTFCMYI